MKQLYYLYDLNLKIIGKYKPLFGKEKDVEYEFWHPGNDYKVFSEDSVGIEVKNYFRSQEAEWLNTLREKLNDDKNIKFYVPFTHSVLFSDIINVKMSGEYRPATIQECIENMTPIEFSETYGNKIQLNIEGE